MRSAAVARWWSPDAPRWLTWLLLAATIALFASPLFVGLNRWDMRNDEAIYSYAVDRMLDTGDWITPLAIPTDYWFVEKPPLKFWLVGGAMRFGLTPRDEFGMRFFDALFGAIAFVYVFALGRRLAGPACGFIAVLVLFTFDPLIFDHGFRSNNMEAPLVLAYAGGLYHLEAWLRGTTRRRLHAWAVTGFLVLGFMTKFVAIAFLPIAVFAAVGWQRATWTHLRQHWRDWRLPLVAAAVFTIPWFAYHTWLEPGEFWRTIFGAHVYTRFTSHLDPLHLQPWHFYFTRIWEEFGYAKSQLIVGAGLVWLVWRAAQPGARVARLVLAWFFVPLLLMSMMTSKLIHYAYPFVLPLAIGAGGVVTELLRVISGLVAPWLQSQSGRFRMLHAVRSRPGLRIAAIALATAAVVIAAITFVTDRPFQIPPGRDWVFRSSSVVRPLVIAGVLLMLAGRAAFIVHAGAILIVQLLLPWPMYDDAVAKTQWESRPLKAIRDCVREVAASTPVGEGIYTAVDDLPHPYSYYLRPLGPWVVGRDGLEAAARTRLFEAGRQTPIITSWADAHAVRAQLGLPPQASGDDPLSFGHPDVVAITPYHDYAVLLPGPFRACAAPAMAGGASPLAVWRPQ